MVLVSVDKIFSPLKIYMVNFDPEQLIFVNLSWLLSMLTLYRKTSLVGCQNKSQNIAQKIVQYKN
jgi:hypothetical protein